MNRIITCIVCCFLTLPLQAYADADYYESSSYCQYKNDDEKRTICDDPNFINAAKAIEIEYWNILANAATNEDIEATASTTSIFTSKYNVICSAKKINPNSKPYEFTECANTALNEFAAELSKKKQVNNTLYEYPEALNITKQKVKQYGDLITQNHMSCISNNLKNYDDAVSNANDIAIAVNQACQKEIDAYVRYTILDIKGYYTFPFVTLQKLPSGLDQKQKLKAQLESTTTAQVLKFRVSRKAEAERQVMEAEQLRQNALANEALKNKKNQPASKKTKKYKCNLYSKCESIPVL
jgi:hypothetical protein